MQEEIPTIYESLKSVKMSLSISQKLKLAKGSLPKLALEANKSL